MKHRINMVLDETVWNGRMYNDGEDPLYDKYNHWMNYESSSADLISKITKYLKEWCDETEVEGGTLMHPNGIMWFFYVECPKEELNWVESALNRFVYKMEKDRDFKSCPIELKLEWYFD